MVTVRPTVRLETALASSIRGVVSTMLSARLAVSTASELGDVELAELADATAAPLPARTAAAVASTAEVGRALSLLTGARRFGGA
jgi:hypothetical protein